MNPAARRLLETSDGLQLSNGILSLPAAFAGEGVLRIPRPSGKPDYVVWTTSMINGSEAPAYRLVTIFDPTKKDEMHRTVLASVFKFTPAEVRLAEQVIQGHSPLQSAET